MQTNALLAFAAFTLAFVDGDPLQPYARSARPAQHHDTAPAPGQTIFAGFKGSPGADACRTAWDGDFTVRYDLLADRWIYTRPAADVFNGAHFQCIAVSSGADPAGQFHRYVFETRLASGARARNACPRLAIWPDAYYFSYVMEDVRSGRYLGPQVCGYDRAAMLAGAPAFGKCVDFGPASPPVMPVGMSAEVMLFWRFSFTTHTIAEAAFVWVAPVRTCTSG